MVLSCVRTDPRTLGFLSDRRRINVAISRAREALIVLGSPLALQNDPTWAGLLNRLRQYASTQDYLRAWETETAEAGWISRQLAEAAAAAARMRATPGFGYEQVSVLCSIVMVYCSFLFCNLQFDSVRGAIVSC